MNRRARICRSAALWVFALTIGLAASARAADIAPYEDDDSNILKVAYYFVYPVGKLAELLVFRPLHTISALSQPEATFNVSESPGGVSDCLAFRPNRACSREK
jgi:hypothetical protein